LFLYLFVKIIPNGLNNVKATYFGGGFVEECELCGRPTINTYVVSVEDVEFKVCASCAQGKKILYSEERAGKQKPKRSNPAKIEYELLENYGNIIKNAREKHKLPLKVIAEMLNVKESFLDRVEKEETAPPQALVEKLEKALSIKLLAEKKPEPKVKAAGKQDKATLGDFVG